MGLARAFTRRLARPGSPDGSEAVVPKSVRPIISMPMGLISTTNQSVHDNPIISATHIQAVQQRQISSASSASSFNDSEASASTVPDTPGMTDTSSVESFSPIEPNHLSQYFPSPSKPAVRSNILSPVPEPEAVEEPAFTVAPAIPKRAPSHSKREHERLSRIRSVRSSTSTGELNQKASLQESILEDVSDPVAPAVLPLRSPSRPSSTNATSLSRPASDEHNQHNSPFSQELRQLQEVAEEFASSFSPLLPQDRSLSELQREAAEAEEDVRVMHTKGLKSHRVSEYLNDISILRHALWDLTEDDDEDEDEEFHDAVDAWA